MNDKEQAARQALEALGRIHFAATELDRRNRVRWFDDAVNEAKEAITALREVLAEQAEQEPVAWAYIDSDGSFMDALDRQHGAYQTPLYAAPARTKDLTNDEIHDVFKSLGFSLADPRTEDFSVARAVIAKFKEKNRV